MSEQSSRFAKGEDEMGMSDAQFKAYLLEQLDNWQRVMILLKNNDYDDVQIEAEKQIEKINTALKF